jgi:hypothetical protein
VVILVWEEARGGSQSASDVELIDSARKQVGLPTIDRGSGEAPFRTRIQVLDDIVREREKGWSWDFTG